AREHERVAALEPHHLQTGLALLDEQRVDVVLRDAWPPRRLAHADALRAWRGEVEQARHGEAVVDDDVGPGEDLRATDRQQPGITWPRADQVHRHARTSSSSAAPPAPTSR